MSTACTHCAEHKPASDVFRTRSAKPSPPRRARAGNQVSLRRLQAKLTVGSVNDPLEKEADDAADRVMRMTDPRISLEARQQISRKCAMCEEEDQHARRKASRATGTAGIAPPIVDNVLSSTGQALDRATEGFMADRFHADFSDVRIHVGTHAAKSADAIGARAYTVGRDIVFGAGQYDPKGDTGRRLLAHELAHVVQQRGASHRQAISRKPAAKAPAKAEECPDIEPGEKQEASKARLQIVEKVAQQEWLIYGFPIGGTQISVGDASRFIEKIINSLAQGQLIYVTGDDSLEVIGYSDCFSGPQVDNPAIRQARADHFCAGIKDHFQDAKDSYSKLIRSCTAAPGGQYVASNNERSGRAQNRGVLVRRIPKEPVIYREGNQQFPFDPTYAPSEANCAAYITSYARDILGRVYSNNAHCSCLVTPDNPQNNCVRHCLQEKMWAMLKDELRQRGPNDPPMDINLACPILWIHHKNCYRDCGCSREFIEYPAFDAVCNIELPCPVDSAAINLLNRCTPATKNDKYLWPK